MSGLALFRRKSESQALVQVPSADLIKSDNELTLPEPYFPSTIDPEEFRIYKESAGDHYDNLGFTGEAVDQILTKLGIKVYPNNKVYDFLKRQLEYYKKSGHPEASRVIWRPVTGESKYEDRIPLRIIKLMKLLQTESSGRYFQGNRDPFGRFVISDIAKEYGYRIPHTLKSMVCFLGIELYATSGNGSGYNLTFLEIIDAWRGPTFSDEEARLPGQAKI